MIRVIEQQKFAPLVIFLFFAVVYGIFVYSHQIGTYDVETDFYGLYSQDANRILHGEMVEERDHAPGYTLLLAFFSLIFPDLFFAGKILSFLAALGCIWVFYQLVALVFRPSVALIGLLLLGFYLIPYEFIVGLDLVFSLFFLVSIWLFFKSNAENRKYLILSGIFSALTFLIRYNGVILPIGVLVIIMLFNYNQAPWSKRLISFSYYLIPFVFLILPWIVISLSIEGRVSSPGLNAAIAWEFYGPGGDFGGDQRQLVDPKFYSMSTLIFYDFRHFVSHYLTNIYVRFEQFSISGFSFPAYYFLLPGVLIALASSSLKQLSFFVFAILGFLVLCLVNYLTRYYLFIFPFFMLFVVLFFFGSIPDNPKLRWLSFRHIRWVAFAILLLFVARRSFQDARAEIHAEPRHLKKIAAKIKANEVQPGTRILARKPHLGYLSGLETVHFPEVDSLAQLLHLAREKQCRYLFYGEQEQILRPQFLILTRPESVPEGFTLVYQDIVKRVFLYEIK